MNMLDEKDLVNARDLLVFTDENDEEVTLEVLDYFIHEDQEYALLTPPETDTDENGNSDTGEKELFIMKVVVNGDTEEFLPVDEDKMEELIEVVENIYNEDDDGKDRCIFGEGHACEDEE